GVWALTDALGEAKKELARGGFFYRSAKPAPPFFPGSHRRGDLADRRGDPQFPSSSRGPLSPPSSGVAGSGAGRDIGRGSRQRDPQVQRIARAWTGAPS